jgi:hypothetical protein
MNPSTRVPSDNTTIWCPIPNWLARGWKMARAGSQVAPPSVVRVNVASLRNDAGNPASEWNSRTSLGKRLRSQMA